MKAKELLRLYEAGRRDFSGENLRGQNFKEKDLSGADFSNADIRGANFTKANLRSVSFRSAKSGLQHRWEISLVIVSWLLSGISGIASGFIGFLIALIFDNTAHGNIITGWIALIAVAVSFVITIRKGIGAGLVTGAVAFTFAGVVAFNFAFAGAGTFAGIVAGSVTFAFAGTVAGAVASAFAFASAGAFAFAFAGTFAFAFAGAGAFVFAGAVAGAVASAMTLLSAYIGWRALQGDQKDIWLRTVAISFATLGGTSFREADLTNSDFAQARLKSTDLRDAILTRTNWHRAKKLDRARVGGTILLHPDVRDLLVTHRGFPKSYLGLNLKGANLIGADLSDADLTDTNVSDATLEGVCLKRANLVGLNLKGANLVGADLSYANLREAVLIDATLKGACLERANLTKSQALNTNFHQAKLTGACLEAWNIDSTTQLESVICDYVYLLSHQQERRPSSGNFAPGEFTKLFEEVLDTIDLIFRNGVDWKAFAYSFKQVQVENEDTELAIQSIENKGDGVVVVKVQASPNADKEKIHSDFTRNYELALKAAEDRYKAELKAKDEQIEIYRQQGSDMREIVGLLASRPINVDVKATAHQQGNTKMAGDRTINTSGGNYNEKIEGDYIQGNYYATGQKQTLANAAAEIQALLKQLEQSYPTGTTAEQMVIAAEAVKRIEDDSTWKQRVVNAVKGGGLAAFEKAIDNPAGAFVAGAIKGWQEVEVE